MQFKSFVYAALATAVTAKEVSGVFQSINDIQWKPLSDSYVQIPGGINWEASVAWQMDEGKVAPGDTFTLHMPCVFKFTVPESVVQLKVGSTVYANCELKNGELRVPYSEMACTATEAVANTNSARGSVSFPFAFGGGATLDPNDLAYAQCFTAGSNTIKWTDGDKELIGQATFLAKAKPGSGKPRELIYEQRRLPTMGRLTQTLIGLDCDGEGGTEGILSMELDTQKASFDCSKVVAGFATSMTPWFAPLTADVVTSGFTCTPKLITWKYGDLPKGARAVLTGYTSSNADHIIYINKAKCAGRYGTQGQRTFVGWNPYKDSDPYGNGNAQKVITTTWTGTTTDVTTLPHPQTTGITETVLVQVPASTSSSSSTVESSTVESSSSSSSSSLTSSSVEASPSPSEESSSTSIVPTSSSESPSPTVAPSPSSPITSASESGCSTITITTVETPTVTVTRSTVQPIGTSKLPVINAEASPSPEETPAESAPAEETPAESAPAEETPAESAPAEETPAESAPAEETPAESAPAEETPAESAPAEETPAESAPAEETPAESAPAEETPAESAPAEETPAESAPAEETPAESASAEETPAESAPAEETSAEASPSVTASPSAPVEIETETVTQITKKIVTVECEKACKTKTITTGVPCHVSKTSSEGKVITHYVELTHHVTQTVTCEAAACHTKETTELKPCPTPLAESEIVVPEVPVETVTVICGADKCVRPEPTKAAEKTVYVICHGDQCEAPEPTVTVTKPIEICDDTNVCGPQTVTDEHAPKVTTTVTLLPTPECELCEVVETAHVPVPEADHTTVVTKTLAGVETHPTAAPVVAGPEHPAPEVAGPEKPAPEVAGPAPEVAPETAGPAPEVAGPVKPAPEVAPEVAGPAPKVAGPEKPAPQVAGPEKPAPEVAAVEKPSPEISAIYEGSASIMGVSKLTAAAIVVVGLLL
ncbi:hypothetical protein DICA1_F17458 [Diutina catenulata]